MKNISKIIDLVLEGYNPHYLINDIVNTIIYEKSAEKKRGIILPSLTDKLKKYIGKDYFIQFSDIEKLGINPRSDFVTTPIGIYAYQFSGRTYNDLITGNIPFAQDRNNLILFKAKDINKLWNLSSPMSPATFKSHVLNLKSIFKNYDIATFDNLKKEAFNDININRYDIKSSLNAVLWHFIKLLSKKNVKVWSSTIHKLGFHGAIDYGEGIIHHNEPYQAFFIGKQYTTNEIIFNNTLKPDLIRSRNYLDSADLKIGDNAGEGIVYKSEYREKLTTHLRNLFKKSYFKISEKDPKFSNLVLSLINLSSLTKGDKYDMGIIKDIKSAYVSSPFNLVIPKYYIEFKYKFSNPQFIKLIYPSTFSDNRSLFVDAYKFKNKTFDESAFNNEFNKLIDNVIKNVTLFNDKFVDKVWISQQNIPGYAMNLKPLIIGAGIQL